MVRRIDSTERSPCHRRQQRHRRGDGAGAGGAGRRGRASPRGAWTGSSALAGEIAADGGTALAIESDVTDQEQAIAAVERTVDELGRLDIVVNNAGVMLLGPIEDAPTEEWDRMIDLNLKGLLYTAHAALPHLLAAAEDSSRAGSPTSSTSAPSPAASPAPAPASTT